MHKNGEASASLFHAGGSVPWSSVILYSIVARISEANAVRNGREGDSSRLARVSDGLLLAAQSGDRHVISRRSCGYTLRCMSPVIALDR